MRHQTTGWKTDIDLGMPSPLDSFNARKVAPSVRRVHGKLLDSPIVVPLKCCAVLREELKAILKHRGSIVPLALRFHRQSLPLLLALLSLAWRDLVKGMPVRHLGQQRPDLIESGRLIGLVLGMLIHVGREHALPVENVGFGKTRCCGIAEEYENLCMQRWMLQMKVNME